MCEVGLSRELLPCPRDGGRDKSSDAETPFTQRNFRFNAKVQNREVLDEVLAWWQALISLIKNFTFFSASSRSSPLFLGFCQTV